MREKSRVTSPLVEGTNVSWTERKILQGMFYLRKYLPWFWCRTLRFILGRRSERVLGNSRLYNFLILARLCYIRRIKNSKIVQAKNNGLFFVQPIDNVFINDEIFFHKVYECHREVLKHDVVVDVGAHVGVFSIKAAAVASKVISIEPNAHNFKLLNFNIRLNHLKNLILVNSAVADYDGDAKLYLQSQSGNHSIMSALASTSVRSVNVKVRKLDTIVKELNIERIDFVKIDVEGAELCLLKGALNTLKKYRPFIVMEYHHDESGKAKNKILDLLEHQNYHCKDEGNLIYAYQVERQKR